MSQEHGEQPNQGFEKQVKRFGLVWLKQRHQYPVGMVVLSNLDTWAEYQQLEAEETGTVGYYTIKPVQIWDGRFIYKSRRPLALFSGHGFRNEGEHMLRGMGGQALSSQAVIEELDHTLVEVWDYPPIEVFISCDERSTAPFRTRWDMRIDSEQKMVGFALGKNVISYEDGTYIIVLDLMREFGVGLDITKNTGMRKEFFDSLFEKKTRSLKSWLEWLIRRKKEKKRLTSS